jgi:hypothetical protein
VIERFKALFGIAEKLIQARPLSSTIVGGIVVYLIGFGLPVLLSLGFHLRMTEGWFSFTFVFVPALISAFFVVFVHWTLARYCQHRPAIILNFLGAMVFPALMFAVWTQMILFRGMD